MRKVFEEVENPLVKVLADMEFEGIRVDMDFLKEYSKELEKEATQAENNVYQEAGVRFNLASPKQLGEVLFDKLKLDPKAKKTKTGQYATGEDVLLKLAHQSKIVDDILAYRELTKLKSTYVDALPAIINRKTGRVHTSYAQAVAVTGRLSSNNPNLQNIPVRTERGREIRKAFVPRDENHCWFPPIIHRSNYELLQPSAEIRTCAWHLKKKKISIPPRLQKYLVLKKKT